MAEILLPVGRMIGGSLYKPQAKLDNFGKPKIGPDGKPMTGFNFGVAIPKTPGHTHWAQTEWGAQIRAVGVAAYPGICDTPSFAWKIQDGDSQIPNKKNRRPCDQVGYPSHWVLWFSQSWAPKLCNANGTIELVEPDSIVPGYFVQVFVSVKSNAPSPTPGVYLNPMAVALAGYGERIETSAVDTAAVGFGTGPAPTGMSPVPLAGMVTAPPNVSVASPYGPPVAAPAAYAPPPVAPPPVAAPAPAPNPAFLQVPAAPVVAPPPPPAPVARRMTAAANGATYEAMIAAGWTDATLAQHGMLAA